MADTSQGNIKHKYSGNSCLYIFCHTIEYLISISNEKRNKPYATLFFGSAVFSVALIPKRGIAAWSEMTLKSEIS